MKLALTQEATSRLGRAEGHGRMNRGAARAQRPRGGGPPGNWPVQGQGLGEPGLKTWEEGSRGAALALSFREVARRRGRDRAVRPLGGGGVGGLLFPGEAERLWSEEGQPQARLRDPPKWVLILPFGKFHLESVNRSNRSLLRPRSSWVLPV